MVDLEPVPSMSQRVPRWLKILLVAGVVALVWSGAVYVIMAALRLKVPQNQLPSIGDLATLLFGAASLALFVFSILIGGVAIIGYQTLREGARMDIEAAMRDRIDMLERELRGRVLSVIGFMIGTLHSTPDSLKQDEHRDFLSEAVWYCQRGYDMLKDLKAKGQGRYMAMNNLVYYSCMLGDDLRREELLAQSRELKTIGQHHGHPPALLTYCRAVLQYGSEKEVADALNVARGVLRMQLTERQKQEATFYVASLADKLAKPQKTSN